MTSDSMEFVVYLIHACANKWHMTPAKVYQKIEKEGCVSKYLVPFYDVLHTQGVQYLVSDIEDYLKIRGVTI